MHMGSGPGGGGGRGRARGKVLIVDDDLRLIAGLRRRLRRRYDLVTAAGGGEALAMLRAGRTFAVIVCDMRMPGIDGIEVLRRFRERSPQTVRLMLTGADDQRTAVQAINEGAIFRFLNKPCTVEDMIAAIDAGLDHHSALREARALRTEAERAAEAKSRFLAAASHDLRQPFQAMRLFHDVLSVGAHEPRQRDVVERLGEAMAAGERVLAALLDVSLLDAGVIRLRPEPVDLAALLAGLAGEWRDAARAKGLDFRLDARPCRVVTDRALLARMVGNLLSNAVRFTDGGGIVLSCRRRGGKARIEVRDTGIGIADEHRRLVFDEFFQVGNSERDQRQGLGLGLSVVARVAALLGIEVTLRSRPGAGSSFVLHLPPGAAPAEGT